MCQHSWYDKNRKHYGRKPNTRRARGLKRSDFGIKHGPLDKRAPSNLQAVEVDTNVKPVEIPQNMRTIKRYAKIYNWYVNHYDKFNDKKVCIQATAEKYKLSEFTITKAIKVCKYILATTPLED